MVSNLKKIGQLYADNLSKHGIDSKSVGWNTPECQELRFAQLVKVFERKADEVTINELGCGYGHLLKYLNQHQFKVGHYFGYDIAPEMLSAAKKYLVDEASKISLIESHELTVQADYSICSGIFNVRFEERDTVWLEHIKRTLRDMYEHANKGISFNMLTKYVDWKEDHLYYGDPEYFFNFCVTEFSRRVVLLHDYPLYEWTIVVYKT